MGTILSRGFLTPEEQAVSEGEGMPNLPSQNATVGITRKQPLEALYGYLYLDDRMDRLMELIKIS